MITIAMTVMMTTDYDDDEEGKEEARRNRSTLSDELNVKKDKSVAR